MATGRAPKPDEVPDNSLLFRIFQFTQAGTQKERGEFWYLDCCGLSFQQKVNNPLSLENARNVNVLYEPDESTHVLCTQTQEMLSVFKYVYHK